MLPFISFEWVSDLGHFVFHGALWYALGIIGMGMTYCIIKAAYDSIKGKGGMPPKGACMDCSTEDLAAVIDYMVSKSQ